MGRFLTRDPQEVYTYYMYAQNNPLFYTDPMGLFAWYDHPDITSRAGNITGVSTQYSFDLGENSMLNDQVLKTYQPAHYMRNSYMTPLEALQKYKDFIYGHFTQATDSCNIGEMPNTLRDLGMFLHAIEDSQVLVHGYWKPWDLPFVPSPSEILNHIYYETGQLNLMMLDSDKQKAVNDAADWLRVFKYSVDLCECKLFDY